MTNANREAEWSSWRARLDANARSEASFFNVRDAAYMARGTTVYLSSAEELAWTSKEPESELLRIVYSEAGAELIPKGRASLALLQQPQFRLNDHVLLRAGVLGDGALRVMIHDTNHPYMKTFDGLKFFPYDPEAVVVARFEALPEPEVMNFATFQDRTGRAYRLGEARFRYRDKDLKLTTVSFGLKDGKPSTMAFLFRDLTSGSLTYGGGREIEIPLEDKKLPKEVRIDFNYAHNFACARTDFANCPLGATDRLDVEIKAGELAP